MKDLGATNSNYYCKYCDGIIDREDRYCKHCGMLLINYITDGTGRILGG
jgi:hypothetical protein